MSTRRKKNQLRFRRNIEDPGIFRILRIRCPYCLPLYLLEIALIQYNRSPYPSRSEDSAFQKALLAEPTHGGCFLSWSLFLNVRSHTSEFRDSLIETTESFIPRAAAFL